MRKLFSALLLATLITTPVMIPTPALSEVRKERVQFHRAHQEQPFKARLRENKRFITCSEPMLDKRWLLA